MTRLTAVLTLALFLDSQALCEEPQGKKGTEKMELGIWALPRSFVSVADTDNRFGIRKPTQGFKLMENPYKVQYDGREYLKGLGIEFPEGAEAIYDQDTGSFVIRNTAKNLELMDVLLEGCRIGWATNAAVEFTVYECVLSSDTTPKAREWLTYSNLMALPATSRKVLDEVSVVAKSGQRMIAKHVFAELSGQTKNPAPKSDGEEGEEERGLQEGELGTMVQAEVTIGPDAVSFDMNVDFRSRIPVAEKQWSAIDFISSFSCWDGYPIVISITPLKEMGKFAVVTVNVQVVNSGGWKIKQDRSEKAAGEKDNG